MLIPRRKQVSGRARSELSDSSAATVWSAWAGTPAFHTGNVPPSGYLTALASISTSSCGRARRETPSKVDAGRQSAWASFAP